MTVSKRGRRSIAWVLGIASLLVALRQRLTSATDDRRGYRDTPFWTVYDWIAQTADQRVGWDRLPTPIGLLVLVGLRNILRRNNLHDTTIEPSTLPPPLSEFEPGFLVGRNPEGSYNDLGNPAMGMRGTRFGRNIPLEHTRPEPPDRLLSPSPRLVSRELLTRHEFIPATTVNLLAASWIQFMVKDWFSHGEGDPAQRWDIPLSEDDPWPDRPMSILKTIPDPTRVEKDPSPPTFINSETHWWDASHIYGTTAEGQMRRRSGKDGKLIIGKNGLLAIPDDPALSPATLPGWWLGLNMLATIFIREHNAVCDRMKAEHPHWSDDELFQRARLVVAALIAKIHTTEWTPAIISHPTTIAALNANWWGLASKRVRLAFGRISKSEVISGIPGSETDHYGIPYSLTEEFTIVYRMHPLLPDDFRFRSVSADEVLLERTFREIAGVHAQEITKRIPMPDLFYTFGTSHPGAIVLNNFPRSLQEFERPDNQMLMDVAAIDILRARELGVPRYNDFRRLLRKEPARSFEELAGDPDVADRIRRVYDGDIERVDLMVGMFAEKRPAGFAFSDTAFRIFILMASRRLNSDRFFTLDFTPEVYSPAGMEWVQNTTMLDVLLRHLPELRASVRGVTNAFHPWTPTRKHP